MNRAAYAAMVLLSTVMTACGGLAEPTDEASDASSPTATKESASESSATPTEQESPTKTESSAATEEPSPTATETPTPTEEPLPAASCTLKGSRPAKVTLTDNGNDLVAEFVGQPVAESGFTGYYLTVFDEPGEIGAQLGATFNNGEPESYFVFDAVEAVQENLEGQAEVDGDKVTATFPKNVAPLGDFDVATWTASFTLAGKDVGNCPKGMGYLPFPG